MAFEAPAAEVLLTAHRELEKLVLTARQQRIKETSDNSAQDAEHYAGYMNYYRQRGVEAIHDGLIVMRRRRKAA